MATNVIKRFLSFKGSKSVKDFKSFRTQALTGSQGESGMQGLSGDQGLVGPTGRTGTAGERGAQGGVGAKGDRGLEGRTGSPGAIGLQGPQGEMGPMPKHETRGDAIRFEIAAGVWGRWITTSDQGQRTAVTGSSLSQSTVIDLINQFSGTVADLNTIIDTVGNLKYIGSSTPGTAESASLWKIKRVDLTDSGGDVPIFWAEGSASFNKIWDDRLTFIYTATGS